MVTVGSFTSIINQTLPEPHAGLLAGILFGTRATIAKDFLDALTSTGTLHIIALSGMNISILASLVGFTLLRIVGRRAASLLTVVIIIGFVWFVGASASVVRAAIMGCIALLAVVFGKQTWSLYSLLLAAGIMLLIHMQWIGDLSFQLSFLATLGLILFAGTASRGFLMDDLRTTLAAQTLTIPLILFTFHRISLISPLTNVLIGWTIQPLTVIGLLLSVTGWIWLPLGQVFAWVAWVFLQYLIVVVQLTAKIPFASIGF